VRARLICVRPGAELSCICTCESGPHTLLADDNLPILPCSSLLPFLGSPFAYPRAGSRLTPADDGLQGIVRCGRLPDCAAQRVRRQWWRLSVCSLSLASPSASRQSRLSGEPPPQSPSARHILDSHLLQSTAALFHLLTRIRRQVLDLMPQSSS
jgi:hypothetical protein